MIIPDTVRVGSVFYKIVKTRKKLKLNNEHCAGVIHYETLTIELDIKRSQSLVERTLLHELIHAIVKERNILLEGVDDEEIVVTELSHGLHQVILDNPEMFK